MGYGKKMSRDQLQTALLTSVSVVGMGEWESATAGMAGWVSQAGVTVVKSQRSFDSGYITRLAVRPDRPSMSRAQPAACCAAIDDETGRGGYLRVCGRKVEEFLSIGSIESELITRLCVGEGQNIHLSNMIAQKPMA